MKILYAFKSFTVAFFWGCPFFIVVCDIKGNKTGLIYRVMCYFNKGFRTVQCVVRSPVTMTVFLGRFFRHVMLYGRAEILRPLGYCCQNKKRCYCAESLRIRVTICVSAETQLSLCVMVVDAM